MTNILIVDDDLRHDKMISYLLLSKGFKVSYILSGDEALEKLKKETDLPSVILMDIMMPQIDGLEVLKQMKENDKLKEIPIIMLTALSEQKYIDKATELGAVDYIEKPFNPSDVLAKIRSAIKDDTGSE